jgi:hypothetical protein
MTSSTSEAAGRLRASIRATVCDPQRISDYLDGLDATERVIAVRSLGAAEQRLLWRAVDGFRPVRLTDLVPPTVPALTPVRHYGRNSMPAFTIFEKRFYRPEGISADAPSELCGANFQHISPLTGPGYFVVEPHKERPEVCVDYRRLPQRAPEGWPEIRSNERGVSRFIYGFMVDTLRRVSEHVTIGSAARHGRDIGAFFLLCRQEPLP